MSGLSTQYNNRWEDPLWDWLNGSLFGKSWSTKETGDTVRFQSLNDKITVEFDLPGVKKEDLEVGLSDASHNDTYLTVKGKRHVISSAGEVEEVISKGARLKGVDTKSIKTKLENGVLTVTADLVSCGHRKGQYKRLVVN